MNIGYACICIGVPNTEKRTCKQINASRERLMEIIAANLEALEKTIDYNILNHIRLFRIGSDLIPFGSSPVNNLPWWELFKEKFLKIGLKIKQHQIRVSTHPGQYTVLNSPDPEVVKRAVLDLEYHNRILDAFGVDSKHKLILHIGGIYNNKSRAIDTFIRNYQKLSKSIKQRLIIENDDKSFTISDVLEISKKAKIPVVYDNLHNLLNPSDESKSDRYWIEACEKTWDKNKDGIPKVHYSQQDPKKKPGSHSKTIKISEFLSFYESMKGIDVDIMVEVKDKNLSALKCIHTLENSSLDDQWKLYRFVLLERSLYRYYKAKEFVKKNDSLNFYQTIEETLEMPKKSVYSILAIRMLWNGLINKTEEKETKRFASLFMRLKQKRITEKAVKNYLYKLFSVYKSEFTNNLFFYDV